MATAYKWKIEDLTYTEEEGVVVHLSFYIRVDGLANTYADARTLNEALTTAGVPVYGDQAPGNSNLRLYRRTPAPIPSTPSSVGVLLEYKTVADYENSFILSGGSSLNSYQTNYDIYGNLISLTYTYPNDYPVEDLRGKVITSAIDESVYIPRTTLTATGSLYVYYPLQIANGWIGHMNSAPWAGFPAGYWMCTGCDFTPRDIGPGRAHLWKFTWQFELNPLGWPVIAKIRDPNTGIVPPDVIPGVGTKAVTWYPSRNFSEIFGDT